MRLLVAHGYLLLGTGSNVYTARLVAALARQGHVVDLVSQEPRPEALPFVDAVGGWTDGRPVVRVLREPVRVTAWRPELGGLLPTYVLDRYEGVEARRFADCTDAEVGAYVDANVAAVRDVVARARPDAALAGHLVMAPLVLARALPPDVPYAVKIHGSALEYTVKPEPERFLPAAREGLERARTVLVGSRHTAESLWAAMDDPSLRSRTRLGPPGVDVGEFRPRPRPEAAADLAALAERLRSAAPEDAPAGSSFARDAAEAGTALGRLDLDRDRLVAFVGKLIVSKGPDLLAAAWPLVLAAVPDARLVVVGFGAWRATFEELVAALGRGDLGAARTIAQDGRTREGGPAGPLRHLAAFLDGLAGDARDRYVQAARALPERVVLTGRLEHDELAPLLAAAEAQVVPSTYPESFGMVAAEAAAAGALPVSAAHSGLAEVTATLAAAVPPAAAPWLSFSVDDDAVPALAGALVGWLEAGAELRAATRAALVRVARERYSWEGVAEGVVAAAQGRLDVLAPVR
jgi:glycosyltransferase involved in cell wall biosynthesis